MRWDGLTAEQDREGRLPGFADPPVVRTFDAPEALDTRFYEVRARSALNSVPKISRVPFRWTINPYRGCAHACVYCCSGDTPILMADGSTTALEDLHVGDAIYGTRMVDGIRHREVTAVLAHWRTVKAAHRVLLADGSELVASGDHRFLTAEGWKHVAPVNIEQPRLTLDDTLVGVDELAYGPDPASGGSDGGVAVLPRTKLRVASIKPLGAEMTLYDITTGTGDFIANGVVSHNCFARPTHKYLDMNAGRDFEKEIVVKVNVPEVLRTELAKPSWKREHVALGTNTDPYQWVEGRYKLMPGIWEAFRDFSNPCSVLTKSPLLLRDLELLKEVAERTSVTANFSVPTLEEKAWRASEPHTPHPRARLEAVAELTKAGIPTGILIAPLMPGINDSPEQVEKIVEIAAEAGAVSIGGIALHLRGEVRGIYMEWLKSYRPDLVPMYEDIYKRGAYAPKEVQERLSRLARLPADRARRLMPERHTPEPEPPPRPGEPQPEQVSLF